MPQYNKLTARILNPVCIDTKDLPYHIGISSSIFRCIFCVSHSGSFLPAYAKTFKDTELQARVLHNPYIADI